MKQFLLVFYFISVLSCNQNAQTKNDNLVKSNNKKLANELIENDFLKYADSLKVDSLKMKLIDSFDIYDEDNFKITHIDAEELAEFSFDFFLPNLNNILAKRNFNLTVQKLNDKDNSFDVLINGKTIQLYTQSELDNYTFWDTAPRNFFRQVNEILKTNNINEHFYLLYGGNELCTILLTDKQFIIISEYYRDNEKENPYKPYKP